jgi:hypothetical protein
MWKTIAKEDGVKNCVNLHKLSAMNIVEMRQRIHQFVENANEADINAMYSSLEHKIEGRPEFSESELNMFYERSENSHSGKSRMYTVEEAHALVRNSWKKANEL